MKDSLVRKENLIDEGKSNGEFDAKKVEKIRRALNKGTYAPNSELIAFVLFN